MRFYVLETTNGTSDLATGDTFMTGREMASKIHENNKDAEVYFEDKLAQVIDLLQRLIHEIDANLVKYTDAGHANCVSAARSFVNEVVKEATGVEATKEESIKEADQKTKKKKIW